MVLSLRHNIKLALNERLVNSSNVQDDSLTYQTNHIFMFLHLWKPFEKLHYRQRNAVKQEKMPSMKQQFS